MTFARAAEDYKSLLTADVVGGCNVTDEGTLDISYDAGIIYDAANDINVAIIATTSDITLTDDDTNYLRWTSGGSLGVILTVPAGNDVLVATIVCAATDITGITPAGFNPSNLTNISTRPTMILQGDKLPHYYSMATIIIKEENLLGFESSYAVRKESYKLSLEIRVKLQSASIAIKDLIAEIDTKNKTNNALQTREYYYEISYGWNSAYLDGVVNLFVECKRRATL